VEHYRRDRAGGRIGEHSTAKDERRTNAGSRAARISRSDLLCLHSTRRPLGRRSRRPRTPGTPATRRKSPSPTPRTRRGRNRDEFFEGREAIKAFLRRKWARDLDYRLKKNLWCFTSNRIAVRFEYESHDAEGQWWRSHGNELWEFDENGLMRRRDASINDYKIDETERKFRWAR